MVITSILPSFILSWSFSINLRARSRTLLIILFDALEQNILEQNKTKTKHTRTLEDINYTVTLYYRIISLSFLGIILMI